MKKFLGCILSVFLLTGCKAESDEINIGMQLRSQMLQAEKCAFSVQVTADYSDFLHSFSMDCTADKEGNVHFTVTAPETIAGISGNLKAAGGQLVFEETALHFPLTAEDRFSPVSVPWILVRTIRSGYLTSACRENDCVRLTFDDTYEEDALHLDIWLNEHNLPDHADILHDGRRIMRVSVRNFSFL